MKWDCGKVNFDERYVHMYDGRVRVLEKKSSAWLPPGFYMWAVCIELNDG